MTRSGVKVGQTWVAIEPPHVLFDRCKVTSVDDVNGLVWVCGFTRPVVISEFGEVAPGAVLKWHLRIGRLIEDFKLERAGRARGVGGRACGVQGEPGTVSDSAHESKLDHPRKCREVTCMAPGLPESPFCATHAGLRATL